MDAGRKCSDLPVQGLGFLVFQYQNVLKWLNSSLGMFFGGVLLLLLSLVLHTIWQGQELTGPLKEQDVSGMIFLCLKHDQWSFMQLSHRQSCPYLF